MGISRVKKTYKHHNYTCRYFVKFAQEYSQEYFSLWKVLIEDNNMIFKWIENTLTMPY